MYRFSTDVSRFFVRNINNPRIIIDRFFQYIKQDIILRPLITYWIKLSRRFYSYIGLQPISFDTEGIFIRTNTGIALTYDTSLGGGIASMEFGSLWEMKELSLIQKHTSPRGVHFDIGASFGWFSLMLAKTKHIKVHAFEPGKKAFQNLQLNIAKNNLSSQIYANNLAVGESSGPALLSEVDFFGNYIVDSHDSIKNESVNMITIDSYVRTHKIKRVDSIKCDVEGFELRVLRGAEHTFQVFHPSVCIEIHEELLHRNQATAEDIFSYFKTKGYTYCRITEDGEIKAPHISRTIELAQGHNFFFYRNKK